MRSISRKVKRSRRAMKIERKLRKIAKNKMKNTVDSMVRERL